VCFSITSAMRVNIDFYEFVVEKQLCEHTNTTYHYANFKFQKDEEKKYNEIINYIYGSAKRAMMGIMTSK
jgi:hypothetical protein